MVESNHTSVCDETAPAFTRGQRVRVTGYPFRGYQGKAGTVLTATAARMPAVTVVWVALDNGREHAFTDDEITAV